MIKWAKRIEASAQVTNSHIHKHLHKHTTEEQKRKETMAIGNMHNKFEQPHKCLYVVEDMWRQENKQTKKSATKIVHTKLYIETQTPPHPQKETE